MEPILRAEPGWEEQLAGALPKEEFTPRKRKEEEQDERNLFDRVKDMFG